jgi:adenosylhomocysteine nucleosidase
VTAPLSAPEFAPARLAVLSALAQEQQGLIGQLDQPQCIRYAGRDFWCGQLRGQPVVLALSRIGKVAAATTACALIERFGCTRIVFTSVAGGVGDGVQVGDVVVGTSYMQHDMDASPLFPRFVVPLTQMSAFPADPLLVGELALACGSALENFNHPMLGYANHPNHFNRPQKVHQGLIASGDRFVNGTHEVAGLLATLKAAGHQPLAVEMEGAAVAQVCHDHGVAFVAVRTISDRADDAAHLDFTQFVNEVASVVAQRIVHEWLRMLACPAWRLGGWGARPGLLAWA